MIVEAAKKRQQTKKQANIWAGLFVADWGQLRTAKRATVDIYSAGILLFIGPCGPLVTMRGQFADFKGPWGDFAASI